MRDGGLWSAPRYWAVFPHVFFFLVFKMYLFIYPFGLFWADSVSYLKVTRMEPFGQSPIFQLCQGQSVLLYLSIVENTQFKPSLLLFPLFLFLFFLYPLLLLRYSNHIFVFSFFFLLPSLKSLCIFHHASLSQVWPFLSEWTWSKSSWPVGCLWAWWSG